METVHPLVRDFAERARAAGGRVLLVGGTVRDRLLRRVVPDWDLEVYGLKPEHVHTLAQTLGEVREVGRTFGVLEVRRANLTFHVSLPRRESKVAPGHRGFAVQADPHLSPLEAARRRDFTVNAMAEDPLSGEFFDLFGGRADLEKRALRIVDAERFADDPLRVLRGAVFVAEFALQVDAVSTAVIRRAVAALSELPAERVGGEWRKLLLRAPEPSRGLKALMEWGVFEVLHPMFVPLPNTPENPRWHPEGNVWAHTLLVVDEAARIVQQPKTGNIRALSQPEQWQVMLAALCHDLGKATTTAQHDGELTAHGHDMAGVDPTRAFLNSIASDVRTTEVVTRLVREHLVPLHLFRAQATPKPPTKAALHRLARRLWPASIFLLTLVADADHRGRAPSAEADEVASLGAGESLRKAAAALGILEQPPAPALRGADLLALGLQPGVHFGTILKRADALADERGMTREQLLEKLRCVRSGEDALRCLGGG